jgi:ABC-2 type transport system permease protein
MNTFFPILKNNYQRFMNRIIPYIIITLISMASIGLGTYLSNKTQQFAHIAVIDTNDYMKSITSTDQVKVTHLDKTPPLSDFYEQKYDACLSSDFNGSFQIKTLKNNEYKEILTTLIQNPETPLSGSYVPRSTGVSIVGFMLMFLLVISFSNMSSFADDKELGQLKRIFAAPVSFFWYMVSNLCFSLSMFIPQFLFLVVLKQFGVSIGLTLLQFLVLILVIGFWGSSFSLLLYTLIKKPDNANMLGSSITILTSVLAGSFYSFSRNNKILDVITRILPQKQILNFTETIGNIHQISDLFPLFYILLLSTVLFSISCIILQKKYVKCA